VKPYCADTSALVAAWVERYPPDHFPPLWQKIESIIHSGGFFAPEEVREELTKRSKEIVEWLDQFEGFWRATDDQLLETVADILAKFPKLVMERKRAYAADPFVIGLAKLNGARVLTEEGLGSIGKPRIPFACREYEIGYCNLLELIREQRWIVG
jgi:Domain of unknown function (DUF4411)